jgi:purine-nucleoside phosphorylase
MNKRVPFLPVGNLYSRPDVEALAEQFRQAAPGLNPTIGLVLGTGFASFANEIKDAVTIPYGDVPGLPDRLATPGHIPEFVMGTLAGHDVICARGKMFLLDGVPAQLIALPIRLFYTLGCRTLIYTNTVGAINPALHPGDFVFLTNHINLMGQNPLVGERPGEWGAQFFDMTYPYDAGLRELGESVARRLGIPVYEGVYGGLLGPSFETGAEIRMLGIVGADVVGMSTVMEVIAARQLGMRVLTIGFVSNMAAGVTGGPIENEDVLALATTAEARYAQILNGVLQELHTGSA